MAQQAGSKYEKNWRSKISLDCPFKGVLGGGDGGWNQKPDTHTPRVTTHHGDTPSPSSLDTYPFPHYKKVPLLPSFPLSLYIYNCLSFKVSHVILEALLPPKFMRLSLYITFYAFSLVQNTSRSKMSYTLANITNQ